MKKLKIQVVVILLLLMKMGQTASMAAQICLSNGLGQEWQFDITFYAEETDNPYVKLEGVLTDSFLNCSAQYAYGTYSLTLGTYAFNAECEDENRQTKLLSQQGIWSNGFGQGVYMYYDPELIFFNGSGNAVLNLCVE